MGQERGEGEGGERKGGKGGEFQKERKVYLNDFLSWWAKHCLYVNSSQTDMRQEMQINIK